MEPEKQGSSQLRAGVAGKDKNGNPIFEFKVVLEGVEGCSGRGFSKKESQQFASKLTLDKLKKKPQFIDEVFAAKANRTKMEEEPVQAIPDTEVKQDFLITKSEPATESPATIAKEEKPTEVAMPTIKSAQTSDEEFDLSDISAKPQSREDIIAAAEEMAFAEAE